MAGAPAIGAASDLLKASASFAPVSLSELGSIASFTPSIKDEKLSSAYAQASLGRHQNGFRFTPTSGSMSGRRSITVLVRADRAATRAEERSGSALNIQPLAFNLDASRGWRKFALPETMGRKPLDPVSIDLAGAKNFSLQKDSSRQSSSNPLNPNNQPGTQGEGAAASHLLSNDRHYVDLGSSYSLTRNLNVTAGVRYSGPDNRAAPLTDPRQDNQALYVGTIFKF